MILFSLLNPEYQFLLRQSYFTYCVRMSADKNYWLVFYNPYRGERINYKIIKIVTNERGIVVDYCNLTETFVAFADEGGVHLLVDLYGVGGRLNGALHLAARKRRVYPHKRCAEKDGLQLLSKKERTQEQKHCENCPKF